MKSRNRERGQAMTEMALLFLVAIAALLGVVDWSWTMFTHESLVSRASMSARWGAVHSYDAANQTVMKELVLYGISPCAGCPPFLGLTMANISVNRVASTYTPEDNSVNITTCQVVVTISGYTIRHFTPALTSRYTARPVTASYVYENPSGSDATCTAP